MPPVWTRTVRWVVCAAAVVFLCGAASGTAQAQVNTGKISFSAGIDFTNAYFFRGLKQENEGFISQPYAELSASLFDAPDAQGLTAVSFTIGAGTASTPVPRAVTVRPRTSGLGTNPTSTPVSA